MARPLGSTWLKLGVALAVLAGGAALALGLGPLTGQFQQVAQGQGEALIGGPFELVDHTGQMVTEADFAGKKMLIYFGYTYCPDVCPLGLAKIAAAYDRLSPAEQEELVPVFITVDPERDTVEAVADYVDLFHPAMVGLTGSPEAVAKAAKAYRVYYRKAEDENMNDYLVDHSSFTYLMDGENRYLTHFGHDATAESIAEGLRQHLGGGA